MEASNKDARSRARFKQQRRDAFRDGRGRGGRGRGRGRSALSTTSTRMDEATRNDTGRRAKRAATGDRPPSRRGRRARGRGQRRASAVMGADLGALFAECDQAALPRQHASAYLDPSGRWTISPRSNASRSAWTRGTYSIPTASSASTPRRWRTKYARAPARGPARALGGLPRVRGDRGSRAGGTDDPAPGATVAGDDGAAAVADRAYGPQAEVDHLPTANAGRRRRHRRDRRGRAVGCWRFEVKRKRVVDAKTATTTPSLTRCWTAPPAKNLGESDVNREHIGRLRDLDATRTTRS